MQKPLSTENLTSIFRTSKKDPFRIIKREGMTIEFKESFNFGNIARYFKTMAAFANNNGGYIIFGVGDKPRRLLGLDNKSLQQFEDLKVEVFTKNLIEYFSPEIKWEHCTFEYKGLSFGVIYTHILERKPCICKKTGNDKDIKYSLKEGEIYYRYGGRSERIRYSELLTIIEELRRTEERKWFNFVKKVARIGIENVGLLDLNRGVMSGSSGMVFIDEELLHKIAFLKAGEFVEERGRPALRLIGDVKQISTSAVVVQEKQKRVVRAIEVDDLVKAFLMDHQVEEPVEYIKILSSANSANYPIYYFIAQAKIKISEAIDIIEKTTSRGKVKKKVLDRLNGKFINQSKLSNAQIEASLKKRQYHDLWLQNKIPADLTEDVGKCVDAFLTLSNKEIIENKKYIKEILLMIYTTYYEKAKSTIASNIRKAISRLDEVLSSNQK